MTIKEICLSDLIKSLSKSTHIVLTAINFVLSTSRLEVQLLDFAYCYVEKKKKKEKIGKKKKENLLKVNIECDNTKVVFNNSIEC